MIPIAAEKQFENKIKDFLKEQNAWFIKYWAGSKFTKDGIPDILCCIDGHFVAIEVKAQTGRPSALQLYNIRKIREAGGFAFVLYPSGYDKFKQFVADLKSDRFTKEMEVILK